MELREAAFPACLRTLGQCPNEVEVPDALAPTAGAEIIVRAFANKVALPAVTLPWERKAFLARPQGPGPTTAGIATNRGRSEVTAAGSRRPATRGGNDE